MPTPGRCSACGLRSSAPPTRGWLSLGGLGIAPRAGGVSSGIVFTTAEAVA